MAEHRIVQTKVSHISDKNFPGILCIIERVFNRPIARLKSIPEVVRIQYDRKRIGMFDRRAVGRRRRL